MATTEDFADHMGRPGQSSGFASEAAAPETGDLKSILDRIADQIADADRRHSAVLESMQGRLGDLVRDTVAVRNHLLPEPDVGRLMAEAPREPSPFGMTHGTRLLPMAEPAHGDPVLHEPMPAPAPLRSASDGSSGGLTRKDEHATQVDPFDVVGSDDKYRDDEPWDAASAEALTKLYENDGLELEPLQQLGDMPEGCYEPTRATERELPLIEAAALVATEPSLAALEPVPVPAPEPVPTVVDAPVALPIAAVPSPVDDIERAWLETKFAEIAAKLEHSLEALSPHGPAAALEERFERLEAKLGEAMSDTATRSDLAGIKSIEQQVEDLAHQLDSVQSQFSRLTEIEAELRALGAHVSDERITKLLSDAIPGLNGLGTADEIANKVAEQVLASLPQQSVSGGEEAQRLDELRSLVHGFITEQRQGDEHTVTMLDAMQQAMIRLLDRMDAIEMGGAYPAEDGNGHHGYPETHDDVASRGPAPVPAERRSDMPRQTMQTAQEAPADQTAAAAAPHWIAMPAMPPLDKPVAALPVRGKEPIAAESAGRPAARQDMAQPQPGVAERTERSKDDFIAAARRAARQAAESAMPPVPPAEQVDMGGIPSGVAAGVHQVAKAKRQPSRLMIALLAVFAIGASVTIVNTVMKMTARPAVERQMTPAGGLDRSGSPVEQAPMIDREGETGTPDDAAPTNADPTRGSRSGQTSPRALPPSLDAPSKLASSALTIDERGAPTGIVLQNSSAITRPEHVARLEEQQQHAVLSARLGSLQVPSPAVPASMVPESAVLGTTVLPVTRDDTTGVSARTANEMPPAFIGPNSLRSAAAKGNASAEFEVGARFAEGKGLQQDLKQAIVWYQRSAAQGFAQAQYRLATMYERGLGVKLDIARAKIWYQRAAEQGATKAMHNLAVLSTGREGVEPDYATAAVWFTKAAEYGLVDSQFNLAVLYDSGLGVAKDARLAYKWYALAARAGDTEAMRRLDSIAAKLATADLARVKVDVDIWRPKPIDAVVNDPRVAGEQWKLTLPVSSN